MTAKIIVIIIGILIGICLTIFRDRNPRKMLITMCIFSFVCFVIYRLVGIWCDDYINKYGLAEFFLRLIPLQLCYQLLFAALIGLIKNNRTLLAAGFLVMPIGGFTTLLFPDVGLKGMSYLHPTYFMFMVIHVLMIAVGIGIYSTNVYRPGYKDVPKVGLFLAAIAVETFIVNNLFGLIGLNPNYMYTMGPNGNTALTFFYKILPVPLLYIFLMIFIFMGIVMIELFLIQCVNRIRNIPRNRKKE